MNPEGNYLPFKKVCSSVGRRRAGAKGRGRTRGTQEEKALEEQRGEGRQGKEDKGEEKSKIDFLSGLPGCTK
jgi:hypothetical protein